MVIGNGADDGGVGGGLRYRLKVLFEMVRTAYYVDLEGGREW